MASATRRTWAEATSRVFGGSRSMSKPQPKTRCVISSWCFNTLYAESTPPLKKHATPEAVGVDSLPDTWTLRTQSFRSQHDRISWMTSAFLRSRAETVVDILKSSPSAIAGSSPIESAASPLGSTAPTTRAETQSYRGSRYRGLRRRHARRRSLLSSSWPVSCVFARISRPAERCASS